MTKLILRNKDTASTGPCGLCGGPAAAPAGMQLVREDTDEPVCPACGQQHAPSLAALVQLADTAERVGRIGRHSVFPPLSALLDLASAAEKFLGAAAPPGTEEKPPE
jgi:hypothetical protein